MAQGQPGPLVAVFDEAVGNKDLYRILGTTLSEKNGIGHFGQAVVGFQPQAPPNLFPGEAMHVSDLLLLDMTQRDPTVIPD